MGTDRPLVIHNLTWISLIFMRADRIRYVIRACLLLLARVAVLLVVSQFLLSFKLISTDIPFIGPLLSM